MAQLHHGELAGHRHYRVGCCRLELVIGYKVFDLIVVITAGGPGFATTLSPFVIYQTGLRGSFDMGTAAAQS